MFQGSIKGLRTSNNKIIEVEDQQTSLKDVWYVLNPIIKHRHQICKAPSLCKTFCITNNCRLIEAGQKISFSQRLSYYVFLTTSFSQRLIQNVFLTTSFSHCCSYIFVLTTLQYSRYPSVLYKYPKISPIYLSQDPRNFIILWLIKLKL